MNYNYHTHTWRCGHASGTEEEYILRAIEGGVTHMGFSDHAPFIFPDGYESRFRVPVADAKEYVSTVRTLGEKYRDKIEIKVGFEMEYYPSHFDSMLALARECGAEYLILGQHFIREEHPDGVYLFRATDDEGYLTEYADTVIAAMETGMFSYVAHPDIVNFVGNDSAYEREIRRICVRARELDIPLEINFLGIRTSRHYPNEKLWKIAGEEHTPVTFGFDAHDVLAAYDGESLDAALALVRKYSLNYIGMPRIRDIR